MSKQTFDFSEALRRMKEGKKVRRASWDDNEMIYLWCDNYMCYKSCFGYKEHVYNEDENFFSLNDVLATDWEEVEG